LSSRFVTPVTGVPALALEELDELANPKPLVIMAAIITPAAPTTLVIQAAFTLSEAIRAPGLSG
jgi:hypothetical protein